MRCSALKDAETGQRGYLLTEEERYLEPYDAGRANVNRELTELQRLGSSGDLPAGETERLTDLTQKKLTELEETIRLRRERGVEAAMEIVVSPLWKNDGLPVIRFSVRYRSAQSCASYAR